MYSVYQMDHVNLFKDLFESMPEYRMIVFLMFLLKCDDRLLNDCGCLKNDIYRLCLEFKKVFAD